MAKEEFEAKRKKIYTLKEQIAKNQGAFDQAMTALKEYGVASVAEAERVLTDYESKEAKAKAELSTLLAEFDGLSRDIAT